MIRVIPIMILSLFLSACGNKKGEGNGSGGTVQMNYPPRQMTYPLNTYNMSNQIEFTAIYPTYYGGKATSFSIEPALPNGLHFSTQSGRIAGTPEQEKASQVYTISAVNEFGATTTQISLSVVAQEPFGLRYLTNELIMTRNDTQVALVPESNAGTRGGAAITSYSISPSSLPAGLNFNTANGFIEGIPTVNFPETVFTITGSNSAGSVSTTITMSVESLYGTLSAGGKHTCVNIDGIPNCWGDNTYGQLGNGNTVTTAIMSPVLGFTGVAELLSMGSEYSCLKSSQQQVYCWGRNQSGQLGSNIVGNKLQPTLFSALGNMSLISASKTELGDSTASYHTCGSGLMDSNLYCWGNLSYGNYSSQGYIPKYSGSNANITGVNEITSGSNFSCFIYGGEVFCFGDNTLGQLGDDQDSGNLSTTAVQVEGFDSVFMMSSGQDHSCAVEESLVYCWGSNAQNQLGRPSLGASLSALPVAVEGLNGLGFVTDIKSGNKHSCAVISNKVYCWGDNSSGQLGRGSVSANSAVPQVVLMADDTELNGVTELTLGEKHSCALANNKIYCWGDNSSKQISPLTTANFSKAVKVD